MKENTAKILKYLQDNSEADLTAQDVAAALGVSAKSVVCTFTSFCRDSKGWGYRDEQEVELADGTSKKVKYLRLTPAGMVVDPFADEDSINRPVN